jgi:hypothetical protein
MGSPDVRAYSRNKRGIAGSLIWVNFDRHALLNLFWNAGATFLADADEIRPQYQNGEDGSAVFTSSLSRDMGPSHRIDHRQTRCHRPMPQQQPSRGRAKDGGNTQRNTSGVSYGHTVVRISRLALACRTASIPTQLRSPLVLNGVRYRHREWC